MRGRPARVAATSQQSRMCNGSSISGGVAGLSRDKAGPGWLVMTDTVGWRINKGEKADERWCCEVHTGSDGASLAPPPNGPLSLRSIARPPRRRSLCISAPFIGPRCRRRTTAGAPPFLQFLIRRPLDSNDCLGTSPHPALLTGYLFACSYCPYPGQQYINRHHKAKVASKTQKKTMSIFGSDMPS